MEAECQDLVEDACDIQDDRSDELMLVRCLWEVSGLGGLRVDSGAIEGMEFSVEKSRGDQGWFCSKASSILAL